MKNNCCVYFYYGNDKELLYIGKTINVGDRWIGHTDPWKKNVTYIGVLPCPDEASMDILERYFLAKYPTKYNVAGTQHGYTKWDIPGLTEPTMYSLAEFEEKYLPKAEKSLYVSVRERLESMGNRIIEVDGDVNLFSDDLLTMDLDHVCFQYQDLYLIPTYATIPGKYIREKELGLSYRTNGVIESLKRYFNELNPIVSKRPGKNGEYHTIIYPGTVDECKHFMEQIRGYNTLYDFYSVKGSKVRDWLSHYRYHYFNVVQNYSVTVFDEGSCKIDVFWSHESTADMLLPVVTPENTFSRLTMHCL